ncbi:hypothetical protein [Rhodocyclus gracilis]|uniref:Polysaccharide deacetylase family protein n=1 Tax=Rhodocyclus tenuis TaxID=1066 RepID=A0A6L5K032_RHOTE|nr:hypothetical protein [Rhodocyclus gracilis]MQY52759.1 hypothetical protein [Rhodocyclus gracilis]
MKATFTISLDCEGKWGVADNLTGNNRKITDSKLREAYGYIFDVLSQNEIKASFAFTSMFSVGERVINEYLEKFHELSERGFSWYEPICKMISNDDFDGWIGLDFFERARKEGHEIAWHGFSHHPLGKNISRDVVEFEVVAGLAVAEIKKLNLKSIVFPRNAVGHLDLMSRNGFVCYRESAERRLGFMSNKYLRVINEFNLSSKSERGGVIVAENDISGLPAGDFLNWPSGPRSMVPDSVTIKRWKNMIEDAVRYGGHVHLWFHPHNLITAPRMKFTFSAIIQYAGKLAAMGDLSNCTIRELHENFSERK